MCTVTFLARKNGYAIGMNRDEKLTRLQALPPAVHSVGRRTRHLPAEPRGGTALGRNDRGGAFTSMYQLLTPPWIGMSRTCRSVELVVSSLDTSISRKMGFAVCHSCPSAAWARPSVDRLNSQ